MYCPDYTIKFVIKSSESVDTLVSALQAVYDNNGPSGNFTIEAINLKSDWRYFTFTRSLELDAEDIVERMAKSYFNLTAREAACQLLSEELSSAGADSALVKELVSELRAAGVAFPQPEEQP
jgi:hypothetical protein